MTYCENGDLAFTIKAYNHENIGNIVQIIAPVGWRKWHGFADPTWIWLVKTQGSPLIYENPDGLKVAQLQGEVPDAFLRRIPSLPDDEALYSEQPLMLEKCL